MVERKRTQYHREKIGMQLGKNNKKPDEVGKSR